MLDTSPEFSSPALRLISQLEREAEYVDAGGLTIDIERAASKLGRFALAAPEEWTLRMVEAAALLGAFSVDFDIGARKARVVLANAGLTIDELRSLGALADDRGSSKREQACRQLSLALLALASQPNTKTELCSWPGDGTGLRLLRSPGVADRLNLSEAVDTDAGARLVLDIRFATRDAERAVRERQLLARRCRFALIPVRVAGVGDVRTKPATSKRQKATRSTIRPGSRALGYGAVHDHDRHARVHLVINGVIVETLSFNGQPGFVAMVRLDLRRDLSQRKVLRGPELDEVLAAVSEAHARAQERLVAYEAAQAKAALARRESTTPANAGEGSAFAFELVFWVVVVIIEILTSI